MKPLLMRTLHYLIAMAVSSLAAWIVLQLLYWERGFAGLYAFRDGLCIGAFVLLFLFAIETLLLKRTSQSKQLLMVSAATTAAIYFVWHVLLMA
ncbi:hypothetical protein [Adhaeretor mobilis]|uniref:Uncharacterized protein n=1 Tax=Adhaeretor mobilis TaxID=1930276 RepID=A0A517N2S6_9BACT|nr:hypothetical protein [Adhaeretor mobilis]QDT01441.1 hypothetical protein HG15A2_47830 [Adhaeretor mobilis]